LVRKICFDVLKLKVDSHIPEFGKTLGEELLKPTKIYTETILRLVKDFPIHGLAHITGGGIDENLVRVLPAACGAEIQKGSWNIPPVFKFLQDAGKIKDSEMWRTFNNGIGLIIVVPDEYAQDVVERVAGMHEKAYVIGEVIHHRKSVAKRIVWK
jgi:phosphoribosylformylglycinamidine cyclo-ligase